MSRATRCSSDVVDRPRVWPPRRPVTQTFTALSDLGDLTCPWPLPRIRRVSRSSRRPRVGPARRAPPRMLGPVSMPAPRYTVGVVPRATPPPSSYAPRPLPDRPRGPLPTVVPRTRRPRSKQLARSGRDAGGHHRTTRSSPSRTICATGELHVRRPASSTRRRVQALQRLPVRDEGGVLPAVRQRDGVMLRTLGIPARVAVGFTAGTYDRRHADAAPSTPPRPTPGSRC